MENTIYITVLDVFDDNESKNNVETYSDILANINSFDRKVIENPDLLKQKLQSIIDGNSDKMRNQFTDAIVDNYDKFDLFDHLVNFLTFRYKEEHRFYGVSYIASKLGKLDHMEKVIFKDYKMLSNPFLYKHDLFFQGNISQDFIGNPSDYNHKDNQIILEGPDRGLANIYLNSDEQVLVRELSRLGKKWFFSGSLNFDTELRVNVIEVIKVFYDIPDTLLSTLE